MTESKPKTDAGTLAPAELRDSAIDWLSAGAPSPKRAIEVIEYHEGGENGRVRHGRPWPDVGT